MNNLPISMPFFLGFWFLFGLVVLLIQLGVLQYVFESLGVNRRYMFSLLVLSLLGSYINIPLIQLRPEQLQVNRVMDFFGMAYLVPVLLHRPGTIIAVNLGGAVLPFILSLYLMIKHNLFGQSLLAVGLVALAVHWMARLVPGVGITVPIFIPPLITAAVAVIISPRRAGPLAYIAGSLGTLIGADLLNLGHIRALGAAMASIGGAGKFDGIFLTGIVAVLLAGILGGRQFERRETAPPELPDFEFRAFRKSGAASQ